MEHITIINMLNDYKKLIPDDGYMLKRGNNYYTVAVVRNTTGWSAVPIN